MALFHRKLSQCVAALCAVPLHHAQRASASARYAGETLAPWEEEDGHLIELHIAPPWSFGLFEDGGGYRNDRKTELCEGKKKKEQKGKQNM